MFNANHISLFIVSIALNNNSFTYSETVGAGVDDKSGEQEFLKAPPPLKCIFSYQNWSWIEDNLIGIFKFMFFVQSDILGIKIYPTSDKKVAVYVSHFSQQCCWYTNDTDVRFYLIYPRCYLQIVGLSNLCIGVKNQSEDLKNNKHTSNFSHQANLKTLGVYI